MEYLPPFWLSMSCPSFPFFLLSEVVDTQTIRRIQRKEDSIRAEEFGKASLFQVEQGLGLTSFSPLIVSEDIEAVQSMLRHLITLTNGSDDSNCVAFWMPSHNKDHAC